MQTVICHQQTGKKQIKSKAFPDLHSLILLKWTEDIHDLVLYYDGKLSVPLIFFEKYIYIYIFIITQNESLTCRSAVRLKHARSALDTTQFECGFICFCHPLYIHVCKTEADPLDRVFVFLPTIPIRNIYCKFNSSSPGLLYEVFNKRDNQHL